MVRFVVASLLLVVAVTFAAAVEARDVATIDKAFRLSTISRKLLDAGGRKLTGEEECQRTCDHVRFKAMCRSLTKLPGVTTPDALLQAAVRVALNKAKQGKVRVDTYAANYHGGNPLASMLATCSDAYGSVADSLAQTQHLIDGGHATGDDLNRQLSSVTTFAQSCTDAFDERPEITPPFPGTLRNVYRVADNVLNIAYLLKKPPASA